MKYDLPREKLKKRGAITLKDVELLQIVIGSGGKGNDYKEIAGKLAAKIKEIGAEKLTIDDVLAIKGIGNAKASVVFAALEFWRRTFSEQRRPTIDSPEDAARHFDNIKDKKQENVEMITLDGARRLIGKHSISKGTLTSSLVHPREIFSPAIEDRAASIIIAHNHPSGTLTISEQDKEVTRRIRDAGELLGIPLDDHLIITSNGYISAQ
jgi:DNA repair protein RadC